jgi:hypothetical protein
MIANVYWSSCKVPRYSCQILMKLEFLDILSEIIHVPNFMKMRPMGAELFHTDIRTDGLTDIKLMTVLRHFTNAPKNFALTLTLQTITKMMTDALIKAGSPDTSCAGTCYVVR